MIKSDDIKEIIKDEKGKQSNKLMIQIGQFSKEEIAKIASRPKDTQEEEEQVIIIEEKE